MNKMRMTRCTEEEMTCPRCGQRKKIKRYQVINGSEKPGMKEDILKNPELTLIAESPKSGVGMVMARGGREIYITGHSEYEPYTLDSEYKRDLGKGLPIHKPENYYRNDDPSQPPLVTWRAHGNLLFTNWLNYYVYQETPFNLDDIH